MKFIFIYIFISAFYISSYAQNFIGNIRDLSDAPINAATIFIKGINQGIISDKNGMFQISLKEGNYSLICQYPGYKEISDSIFISKGNSLNRIYKLEKDTLFIDSITEKQNEYQANTIIRNCINSVSKDMESVLYYNVSHYIRGQMIINEVSDFIDNTSYKLDRRYLSSLKGHVISTEIYGNTQAIEPGSYKINIEGYQGYIPRIFTEKGLFDFFKESIYTENYNGFVSPLSSNAFKYYRFEYGGYYKSTDTKIYKIKVNAKFNNPDLINGYLFIKEEGWNINYVILNTDKNGLKSSITISYNQLQPITIYNDIAFRMVGVKGSVEYYSGLKLNNVDEKREFHANKQKNSSEYIIDTCANKRDSSFWNKVRLQPIGSNFLEQISDTMNLRNRRPDLSKFIIAKLLLGGYLIGNDTSKISLKYNGVKMIFRDYNYVDGFWLGNRFNLKVQFDNNTNIEALPYIYCATARKRLLGGNDIMYNYNLKKKGQFTVSFGTRSEDFNNLSLTRYQNYFNSLILGENTNFFYQHDFLYFNNSIHLNPKIKAFISFGIDKRSGLNNYTDFNILNRNKIQPNIFPNSRFDRTYYSLGFLYSPYSNYTITEAVDMHNKKVTPVFNIEYQEGFSSWQVNNSKYQKLKGGISHNIPIDYFNSIDYKIEAGTYIKTDHNMHFTDYQHFGASDMILNLNSLFDSFLLLDNYQLQTNRYWINMFLNYSGRYVFLKHIPFLQRSPFTENIHLKTLFTPDSKSYVEAGYSISFNRFLGLGAFTSFHNIEGRKFGIQFSFNIRSLKLE